MADQAPGWTLGNRLTTVLGVLLIFMDIVIALTRSSHSEAVAGFICQSSWLQYPAVWLMPASFSHYIALSCNTSPGLASEATLAIAPFVVRAKLSVTIILTLIGLVACLPGLCITHRQMRSRVEIGPLPGIATSNFRSRASLWVNGIAGILLIGVIGNTMCFDRAPQDILPSFGTGILYSCLCVADMYIVLTVTFLLRYLVARLRSS